MSLVLLGTPALAQEAPPAKANCAAMDQNLPADLTGWTAQTPLAAAANPAGLAKAAIAPGKAIAADLPQTSMVKFVTQPERPGGSASHGGMYELRVEKAGTYVFALGSGAWIDVLKDGKPLTSTAHSHGPACSTVDKLVDFRLEPGRYVLQLSAAPDPKAGILVTRRP
ncbi:MAG: homogentisate 1,2-dioxygenase [Proteobacteria bacterium]|nr:homogentisate 1,2-dioxygenase [Pseudomonadota bacterium]